MNASFKYSTLLLAMTASVSTAVFADDSKDGFIEGSSFNLDLKNY